MYLTKGVKFCFLILIVFFFSCKNEDDINRTNPEIVSSTFSDSVGKSYFKYYYSAPDNVRVNDDEYNETLIFSIDSSLTKFSYIDSTLIAANCFYKWECFCNIPDTTIVLKGKLNGQRINKNVWKIQAFIRSSDGQEKLIEREFNRSD